MRESAEASNYITSLFKDQLTLGCHDDGAMNTLAGHSSVKVKPSNRSYSLPSGSMNSALESSVKCRLFTYHWLSPVNISVLKAAEIPKAL